MSEHLLGELQTVLNELGAAQQRTAELTYRAHELVRAIDKGAWVPSTDQDLAVAHRLGGLSAAQQAFLVTLVYCSICQGHKELRPYRCEVSSIARLLPVGTHRRIGVEHPVAEAELKGTWAIYRSLATQPGLTLAHRPAPYNSVSNRRRQGTRADTFTLGRRVGDVVRRRCVVMYESWDDALAAVCQEMHRAKRPPRATPRKSSPGIRAAVRGGA